MVTNNSDVLESPLKNQHKKTLSIINEEDPSVILKIHEIFVKSSASKHTPIIHEKEDSLEFLQKRTPAGIIQTSRIGWALS